MVLKWIKQIVCERREEEVSLNLAVLMFFISCIMMIVAAFQNGLPM